MWIWNSLRAKRRSFFPHLSFLEETCVGVRQLGTGRINAAWAGKVRDQHIKNKKKMGRRAGLRNFNLSRRLVCTLHLPPRDAPPLWCWKDSVSICVGRASSLSEACFTGNLVLLLYCLIVQDRFKMKKMRLEPKPKPPTGPQGRTNAAQNDEGGVESTVEGPQTAESCHSWGVTELSVTESDPVVPCPWRGGGRWWELWNGIWQPTHPSYSREPAAKRAEDQSGGDVWCFWS